jgi:hypothetical protein
MADTITVSSNELAPEEIRDLLMAGEEQRGLALELRGPPPSYRYVDPTVLVAIVGATGTALGALIAGALRVVERTAGEKIVLIGSSGRQIQVPRGTTGPELDEFIKKARELDVEEIII